MKKFLSLTLGLLFGVTSLSVTCMNGMVPPGIKQSCVTTEQPNVIYMLEVDQTQCTITLEHAIGTGCSREPVSSIVERAHAIAGLNCNNYRRGGAFNGNAVDFLKIKDDLYADPNIRRSVICWSKNGTAPLIGTLNTTLNLTIGLEKYSVDRVNQPRQDSEIVLYTPAFGTSTRTRQNGTELIIAHNRVIKIILGGNSVIPTNGMVLSIGKNNPSCTVAQQNISALENVSATYQYKITVHTDQHEFDASDFDYITSGAGLLVANGTIVENLESDFMHDKLITHCADEAAADFAQEKERKWLIYQQHPRTAVGILPNGSWLFVVVDGRQPGYSTGMSLPELARFMHDRGCIYALNLGGGGCSTLVVNGSIINSPSGTTAHGQLLSQQEKLENERPVDAAFVVS